MMWKTLALVLAATASVANAAKNVTVYANSTSISYTGLDWKPYDGCGGTYYTYSRGHFFTFTFTGVGIYMYGTKSLTGGQLTASLDGQQSFIDRWSTDTYGCGYMFYGKAGLENTQHTFTVALTGNSAENSTTNGYIDWQWIQYTELEASDLTSSTPSSTGGSSTSLTSTSTTSAETGGSSKSNNGAVIGGAVGGTLGGLALIGLIVFFVMKNRKKNKNGAISQTGGRADLDPGYHGGSAGGPYGNGPGSSPPMSNVPQSWAPQAGMAQNLSPSSGRPESLYGGSQPAPLTSYAVESQQALTPQQFPYATPHGNYAPVPSHTGSNYGGSNYGDYTAPPPGAAPVPQRQMTGQMSEPDVQRIAERVASMMGPTVGPSGATSQSGSSDNYDAPPMYVQGATGPVNPDRKY